MGRELEQEAVLEALGGPNQQDMRVLELAGGKYVGKSAVIKGVCAILRQNRWFDNIVYVDMRGGICKPQTHFLGREGLLYEALRVARVVQSDSSAEILTADIINAFNTPEKKILLVLDNMDELLSATDDECPGRERCRLCSDVHDLINKLINLPTPLKICYTVCTSTMRNSSSGSRLLARCAVRASPSTP